MKKIMMFVILVLMSVSAFAISDKQKSDLLFMYQEEKLARDVYTTFSKIYTLPVFGNISKSETTHMSQIKTLLITYQIPVPELEDGKFLDKDLQKLYTKMIKDGKVSQKNALKVAISIEEKDIQDLKEKIKDVPTDIKLVYQNLLLGSEKHKKSFSKF